MPSGETKGTVQFLFTKDVEICSNHNAIYDREQKCLSFFAQPFLVFAWSFGFELRCTKLT